MVYDILFSARALKTIGKWKKSNQTLYKKVVKVLDDIHEHPRTGIGHPEPLVGGNNITFSRRISANHRIIYDIFDERVEVLIVEAEGHYGDK